MSDNELAGVQAQDGEAIVDARVRVGMSCAALTNQAIDGLDSGESFVLVADHDPIALNYMLQAERPGEVDWAPLEQGPERWQVRIRKTA